MNPANPVGNLLLHSGTYYPSVPWSGYGVRCLRRRIIHLDKIHEHGELGLYYGRYLPSGTVPITIVVVASYSCTLAPTSIARQLEILKRQSN
jgi:hypothetical protein